MGRNLKRSGNPAKRGDALTSYWHGGAPGLNSGDALLPRVSLKAIAGYAAADVPYDPHRVYLTTDRQLARAFAASLAGGIAGSLYNVRPVGDLAPDPDYPFEPPISFTAVSAVIVKVVEPRVRMSEAEQVKATARWTTWPEGIPMYDEQGYLTLCQEWADAGATEADLRGLGPWVHMMAAATILEDQLNR